MNCCYPSLDRFDIKNMNDASFMETTDMFAGCAQSAINYDKLKPYSALSYPLLKPTLKKLHDKLLPHLKDEWASCEALETNDDFASEEWDMIFSSSSDASHVEHIATKDKQCNNTQPMLPNSKGTDSTLSLFPKKLQVDASVIPCFNKSNVEVGNSQETILNCELEEMMIFPDKKISDWSTNFQKEILTPKGVTKDNTNDDLKKEPEKPTLACEPTVAHSESKTEKVKDSDNDMSANFRPSNWDVIFGRGKDAYDHIGNRRFKIIVAMHLREYADAKNQVEKAHLVDRIIKQIREASPNAGFVKKDGRGNWRKLDTAAVQQRVARTFRDSMIGQLRCNSKFSSDEKRKNTIEAQNTIFRSCQIRFSRDASR